MTSRYRLPNGLTVVFHQQQAAPVVAFQVWVKVGSADETAEDRGEEGRREGDEEGEAGAQGEADELVAEDAVGAEQVAGRRAHRAAAGGDAAHEVAREGVVARDEGEERGERDEHGDEHEPHMEGAVAAQARQEGGAAHVSPGSVEARGGTR